LEEDDEGAIRLLDLVSAIILFDIIQKSPHSDYTKSITW